LLKSLDQNKNSARKEIAQKLCDRKHHQDANVAILPLYQVQSQRWFWALPVICTESCQRLHFTSMVWL